MEKSRVVARGAEMRKKSSILRIGVASIVRVEDRYSVREKI